MNQIVKLRSDLMAYKSFTLDAHSDHPLEERERAIVRAREHKEAVVEAFRKQAECIRELERRLEDLAELIDSRDHDLIHAEERIRKLEVLLDCRAGRLLKRHIPFIVVKQAEPYYCEVYGTIRQYELAKGDWTQGDENIYREQCALFGRFESGSEPEAIR